MGDTSIVIAAVDTCVLTRALKDAPRNPRMAWTHKNVLLVTLQAENGAIGIGECWCDGGSPAITAHLIEQDLKPMLLGADARDYGKLWQRIHDSVLYSVRDGITYAALSGLDIAVWDLVGKHYGTPVSRLLGGYRDRVFAYASGGLYAAGKTASELGEEMRRYVKQGFRGVKLKVAGASLAEDEARVAAVREAVGADVRVMVDAVYALTVPDALRMARRLERYDIHFLEAPVAPTNVRGMARVARSSPIPIAGNEFAYGRQQFRNILEREAAEFVHLDTILCGGITEALRIASLADAFGVMCSFHAASSAVCFAANLHVAAATPNCDSIEYHMVHQLLFDRLPADTFVLDADGCIVVPDRPGLGLGFTLPLADATLS
jgi:L-alanine-DL-glutamate epimerase-like enolase superfamily enzyme